MIYDTLAHYYDALVKDDEATQAWVDWIQASKPGKKVLELACGSGEITHQLSSLGYDMTALDLSKEMIERAKAKDTEHKIKFYVQNMLDLQNFEKFDTILCLCDSFNYLLEEGEVQTFFKQVSDHLNEEGLFFFDMHSWDRLEEFSEEFNETGSFDDGCQCQWSIMSEDELVYQDFAFYKEGQMVQEHHIQRVYDSQWIQQQLEEYFNILKITTDFDLEGLCEGEKYFYICQKKGK